MKRFIATVLIALAATFGAGAAHADPDVWDDGGCYPAVGTPLDELPKPTTQDRVELGEIAPCVATFGTGGNVGHEDASIPEIKKNVSTFGQN